MQQMNFVHQVSVGLVFSCRSVVASLGSSSPVPLMLLIKCLCSVIEAQTYDICFSVFGVGMLSG